MSPRVCSHCGAAIRYQAHLLSWVHIGTGSKWCDASATTQATP